MTTKFFARFRTEQGTRNIELEGPRVSSSIAHLRIRDSLVSTQVVAAALSKADSITLRDALNQALQEEEEKAARTPKFRATEVVEISFDGVSYGQGIVVEVLADGDRPRYRVFGQNSKKVSVYYANELRKV